MLYCKTGNIHVHEIFVSHECREIREIFLIMHTAIIMF